jgi:hypothetical protein
MAAEPPTRSDPRTAPRPADTGEGGRFARSDAPLSDAAYTPGPPAAPPSGADWRATVMTASGLNVLAGIWLIIAPFVLGYGHGDPYWNDIVFGAIVGVLAIVRMSGAYREHWLSYVNALIGVWIFVSAFWLDSTGRAGWNDIILGAIVFFLGAISGTTSQDVDYADRRWYRR